VACSPGPDVVPTSTATASVGLHDKEALVSPDFAAEPGAPVPDRIPDDLVDRYGSQARHTVRYRRSRRYRLGFRVRQASEPLHDREMWSLAAIIFFWGVAVLAIMGGIGYAVFLWPRVGLSILGTFLALLGISLLVALKLSKRE
jgi:hypothetical protein